MNQNTIDLKNEEPNQSTPQNKKVLSSEYSHCDENGNPCKGVRIHPEFEKLIHPLTHEEWRLLEKDILDKSCLDPIKVWQGYIVDGHHRYGICQKHNLSFKTEAMTFEDEESVKLWMIDNQMGRRNITDAAKISYALLSEDIEKERAERRMKIGKLDPELDLAQGKRAPQVRDIIAKKAGVGHSAVDKFRFIQEKAPEVAEALCKGNEIIDAEGKRKRISVDGSFKELKSMEKKTGLKQKYSTDLIAESDKFRVIKSSVGDLKSHIEPNSLDAIITDPPYPEEYISVFEELGKFASYALKDGAPCIVMTGQAYLGEYINLLSKNLDYHWTLAYMLPGSTAQIWGRRVGNTWKPVLLFSKGKFDWTFFQDSLVSPKPSKDHHEWGQSVEGFQQLVQRFSMKDGLVCDPFCGAGTTGLACLKEGRHFIGADIDEESVKKSLFLVSKEEEQQNATA
jgi:site-specific DNA-methyltransferase (adenine-specific)